MSEAEAERVGTVRWWSVPAVALVAAGVLVWLWPIGLGGRMPVGGDVTQFSIGLMAELGRALRAGRLPVWNDLWGYGFPGLAESQMGVYYPPHWVLFGLSGVEVGVVASLVGHALWSAFGAFWAARRFGAGRRGGVVAGFAFATSGFFLIHLPHQWGASTASWMPWAWGLAWSVGRGEAGRRAPLWLAAVLAIQILPGHFQLAFITQVTTALIGLGALTTRGEGSRGGRAIALGLAMAAVVPLAIAQLGPTAELAARAGSQRSVAYLSAFAVPPSHLVSYVAPGLFHESPLWRPLAWDAFHAMPEEHRATVGLVPLFLAMVALGIGRRDPAARVLGMVALVATLLSLGPYAPGFATLCRLPGFSFFRAPARWGAAAMLALALLAGRGLDAWRGLANPGRSLRGIVLLATAALGLVVGLFEVALAAHEPTPAGPSWPGVAALLQRAFALLPWTDDEPNLAARLAEARRPLDDVRVAVALARQGRPATDPADRTLARRRVAIYGQELGPTLVALAALIAASFLARRSPRAFEAALGLILLGEAGYWSRQRPFDLGPIRPLTEQSAVLGRLAALPRGTRSIDPSRNLPMVAAIAPLEAYRTLDLPILPGLTRLAAGPAGSAEVVAALRSTGAGVRVGPSSEGRARVDGASPFPGWERAVEVDDPTLLGWLHGADWVRSLGPRAPTKFTLWRPLAEPARAWFVSASVEDLAAKGDDPRAVLKALAGASPLASSSSRPENVEVTVESSGPGTIVVAQLDYPRWRADLGGRAVPIARVFDGWVGVAVPDSGRGTLRLTYDDRPDRVCLGASGLAWVAWGLVYWRLGRRRTRAGGEPEEPGR